MSELSAWEPKRARFTRPDTTRSRIALEIAAELVAASGQPYRQAKILLREQGTHEWPLCLFATSTIEGIDAVIKHEAALAMVNPSAALTLAYRGTGPYSSPQPVRTIAVVPSEDQYVFAVKRETGIQTFEDIGRKKFPLKVSLRGQSDHYLHMMLDHAAAAAGFTMDDIKSWGGEVTREGMLPRAGDPKFQKLARGEVNAIFDEAVQEWIDDALSADMTILSLAESTIAKLEGMGYRRAFIQKKHYPRLPQDILTMDFSGWAIFVHAELPDDQVSQICAALDARRHLIPWEDQSALPLERMCYDSREAPMAVPLHPAAERFWRNCGYLPNLTD